MLKSILLCPTLDVGTGILQAIVLLCQGVFSCVELKEAVEGYWKMGGSEKGLAFSCFSSFFLLLAPQQSPSHCC